MKIQHLAVIFVIIIMPISIVISTYVNNLIDVANKEAKFNSILLNSTYDAVRAYQINTMNNDFASIHTSRERDLNASISSFFNSLATGIASSAYTKTELNGYVPAVLFTLYDGFYVYGPHENYVKIREKTVLQKSKKYPEYIGSESDLLPSEKINTEYGLKPYTYYSCEYQGTNYHLIINYTLDNYIAFSGKVNDEYVTMSGYYINPDKISSISSEDDVERKVTLKTKGNNVELGPEVLGEYIQVYDAQVINKRTKNKKSYHEYYNYINYNGSKYYYDDAVGKAVIENNSTQLNFFAKKNRTFDIDYRIPVFKVRNNLKEYISIDELKLLSEWRGCTTDDLINKTKFQDVNNYWYYYKAKDFSEKAYDYLSLIELNSNGENGYTEVKTESFNNVYEIETSDGIKAGEANTQELKAHEKYNYNGKKIFDYKANDDNSNKERYDSELESSYFNLHRMDVIISNVEASLADAISDFNIYQSNSTYSYRMPAIRETDWYKIANNVNVVSFMQGQVVGNYKFFNNYAVVTNTKNKEFISKDAIYVQDVIAGTQATAIITDDAKASLEEIYKADNNGNKYHLPGCVTYHKDTNSSNADVVGYRLIDYDIDSFLHDYKKVDVDSETVETEPGTDPPVEKVYTEAVNSYMQPGTGAYECIVSRNGIDWTYDELLEGVEIQERKDANGNDINMGAMNENVRTAYISALAREKGASFKNFSMLELEVK